MVGLSLRWRSSRLHAVCGPASSLRATQLPKQSYKLASSHLQEPLLLVSWSAPEPDYSPRQTTTRQAELRSCLEYSSRKTSCLTAVTTMPPLGGNLTVLLPNPAVNMRVFATGCNCLQLPRMPWKSWTIRHTRRGPPRRAAAKGLNWGGLVLNLDQRDPDEDYAAAGLFTMAGSSFSAEAARTSEAMQITKHTTLTSNRFRFVRLIARNMAEPM